MSKIEIKQLSFEYGGQTTPLFDHAELNLDTGWKLGLVGRNGRGKTTLLKLLQGLLPYTGTIQHSLDFVYFPQKLQDKTQLTFYVLTELGNFEQWEIERELNLLGVDPDILWRPFDSLSGGEKTKVLLAQLFTDEQHFPLIDEPTNHLDIAGREQVATYLNRKRQGYIVVSHDRFFLDQVVDHILAIDKTKLRLYQGNFSTYEEQKRLQDEFEQAQNEKLQREIGRLKQTAAEKAEWSRSREGDKAKKRTGFIDTENRRVNKGAVGADAARTMKRSKAIVQRLNTQVTEKEKLLKDIEYVEPLRISYQPSHHRQLLRVEDLTLRYTEPLFQPLTFEVNQGEQVALVGRNGSGKSSIIQALLGTFTGEVTGTIHLPPVTVSYVRQNYEDNRGSLQAFAEENQLDYQDFLWNLQKLGMEREVFTQLIEQMSMGQRKKVELAKSLATPAELFIWDEPLNYLDVFNHQQIEALLLDVRPTLLVVDHDQSFLQKVATRQIQLEQ